MYITLLRNRMLYKIKCCMCLINVMCALPHSAASCTSRAVVPKLLMHHNGYCRTPKSCCGEDGHVRRTLNCRGSCARPKHWQWRSQCSSQQASCSWAASSWQSQASWPSGCLCAVRPILDRGRGGRDGKTMGGKEKEGGMSVLWHRAWVRENVVVVVVAVRGAVPLSLLAVLCEPGIFAHSHVIFKFFSKFEI